MKVAVVDCGMSNLGSVTRALHELGANPYLASSPEQLRHADRMILPGVGSFGDGMACLTEKGLDEGIREQVRTGKPILGICLGMQLLATSGTEGASGQDWAWFLEWSSASMRLDAVFACLTWAGTTLSCRRGRGIFLQVFRKERISISCTASPSRSRMNRLRRPQ